MALSSGNQRMTSILTTPSTSGSSTVSQSLDAREDREILAIEIGVESIGADEQHNGQGAVWTGSAPLGGTDFVNDNAELAVNFDFKQESDDTNGVGHSENGIAYFTFNDTPFEWDEHVTLNVEWTEETANQSNLEVIVHWREA